METPDPPFMTPRKGPQNRWQLDTQNDIPRILRAISNVRYPSIYEGRVHIPGGIPWISSKASLERSILVVGLLLFDANPTPKETRP